jgi:DNA-directed RNA polymerase specialized sigma24 family protein
MRNYVVHRLESNAMKHEVPDENLDLNPHGAGSPETLAARTEMIREIAARLSGRELECLRLRAEDLTYSEIAQRLQICSGTVGALLTRAHRKIRETAGAASLPEIAAAVEQLCTQMSGVQAIDSRRRHSSRLAAPTRSVA